MKTPSLVRAFALAAAFSRCHADISWRAITCAGKSIDGATPDQMWDNARAMVSRAVDRINVAKKALSVKKNSEDACAANNCKWLWGTKPNSVLHSIGSGDKAVLDNAIALYDKVSNLLSTDSGYFFCDDEAWQWMYTDQFRTGAWHFVPPGGTAPFMVLLRDAGRIPPPTQLCTAEEVTLPGGEVAWSKMMGLTVTGRIPQYNAQGEFTGEYTEVPVVFLCVGNHAGYKKATLPLNYSPAVDRDDPDNYGSAAGTIIHEMTHVAGLLDVQYPDLFKVKDSKVDDGVAYKYDRSVFLAQTDTSMSLANPDNFRVFAEMSMANPTTRWGASRPAA